MPVARGVDMGWWSDWRQRVLGGEPRAPSVRACVMRVGLQPMAAGAPCAPCDFGCTGSIAGLLVLSAHGAHIFNRLTAVGL